MSVSARPCDVQLCSALALEDSRFCVAHRTAKKLAQVNEDEKCRTCGGVLHVGDYVTLLSIPDRSHHAICPKDRSRAPRRTAATTPLFDDESDVAHV